MKNKKRKTIWNYVILLILAAGFSNLGLANEKDNGGSTWEMKKQKALNKSDLTTLLTTESKVLKKALEGFALYLSPSNIENQSVKKMFSDMKSDNGALLEDIRYSNFSISETEFQLKCNNLDLHACTENYIKGSTIYLNINGLEKAQVTLAELVGLLMHEYSRHFIGDADSKHKLANYFEDAYIQGKNKGKIDKIFSEKEGDFLVSDYSDYPDLTYAATNTYGRTHQESADLFCRYKGYKQAVTFSTRHEQVKVGESICGWQFMSGSLNAENIEMVVSQALDFFTEIGCQK